MKTDRETAQEALEKCRRGQCRGHAAIIASLIKSGKVTYAQIGIEEKDLMTFLHQAEVEAALNAVGHCERGEVVMYAPILQDVIYHKKKVTLAEVKLTREKLQVFIHQADVENAKRAILICRQASEKLQKQRRKRLKLPHDSETIIEETRPFLDRLLPLFRHEKVTYREAGTTEMEILGFINLFLSMN